MDPMIIGQVMYRSASFTHTVQSMWMPRQGDTATFSVETISSTSPANFTFRVMTKNIEDADSSAATVVAATALTSGTKSVRASGIKELIRYEIITNDTTLTDMLTYRCLGPQWEVN